MRRTLLAAAAAAALAAGLSGASAQEKLRIGLMSTLSGPSAALGEHMRDGFLLAVKHADGKLGGVETEVITVDDELKPDVGVEKAKALIERDKVQVIAGVVFSNVMAAVARPVTESEVFLVSGNAGPSVLAGKGCNPFFFSASYQNDQMHEVMGKYAQDKGYKRMFLIAPNYQAGKDSLAGFKRHFKGEVVDEVYTQLGQLDFSAEMARIAAAKPDAVFTFMPGGMGINLVKQYRQAGLADSTPFLSAFTVDGTTLPAMKETALGLFSSSEWTTGLENDANRTFVADFEKEYGYVPSLYAAQGYDAAQLIGAGVKAANGDLADKAAIRKGMEAADFPSVRGDFKMNTNHFPIQDFYLVEAAKRDDGKFDVKIVEKVFDDYGDVYAADCKMK
ncbi:ABC transporter substrate-binding protein [Propylenella binzhouense]|uniref:ABC transporter substrate-binding protein n=1 Tax=Propylenella binzhouense TaxID=2555902 RepID=A0A964WTJ5_9HYPH|nr:ABC transporter substrate-binding protein [Propylenella binzhouense]MYZ48051.1 ABC transporter substrate-binding protein [Propylenella binzhouense]